jgi:hypothetical protein
MYLTAPAIVPNRQTISIRRDLSWGQKLDDAGSARRRTNFRRDARQIAREIGRK